MSGPLGILGPGTLGLSLGQWAAERGQEVRLLGRSTPHAQRALVTLRERWQVLAHQGKLTLEEATTLEARVSAWDGTGIEGCEALLEAVPENPELKAAVWREVAPRLNPSTLCLTGSSALPVGSLAQASELAGRLLGFHLFVPVRRMRIVELVAPEDTAPHWKDRAEVLAGDLGLRVARVRDGVGYAAARMSLALGLEAMRLLEEGVASAEDLDALMQVGYGHPVGPLELSDRVGLDLRLAIVDRLQEVHGDRFCAPRGLRDRVQGGQVGLKAGQGFISWPEEP